MTPYTAEERRILAQATALKKAKRKEANKHWNARKPAEKRHRGRERDNGYLAFLRRQPCVAFGMGFCGGPIQAAHIRYHDARYPNSAGGQVKNHDRWATPLCAEHHAMQHNCGDERRFWAMIGKDAYEEAAAHYEAYLGGRE